MMSPVSSPVLFTPFGDRKSTRLNSSHLGISYAVFCLKKKKNNNDTQRQKIQQKNPFNMLRLDKPISKQHAQTDIDILVNQLIPLYPSSSIVLVLSHIL